MKKYRQGDVLVIEVKKLPADTTPIARENDRIVLAHGEVTGHSHAIESMAASFVLAAATQRRFLDAKRPVRLDHEEHDTIKLPRGTYEVVIQREYEPGAIRNVAD